jgi:putative PIN family toxin of toxin-antitoxin system
VSSLRVVLDTNVLVSGLHFPNSIPGKIVEAWQSGAVRVVVSQFILEEMVRILPRLKNRSYTEADAREFAGDLPFATEIVEPAVMPAEVVRDASDAPVLGTLIAAKADYLITGDKDLLELAGQYPIVTPAAFWERHG